MDRSYLTPNGKQGVHDPANAQRQPFLQDVTVPTCMLSARTTAAIQAKKKRWPDFRYRHEAQDALDTFARENLEEY